jgi:hypothetical protein
LTKSHASGLGGTPCMTISSQPLILFLLCSDHVFRFYCWLKYYLCPYVLDLRMTRTRLQWCSCKIMQSIKVWPTVPQGVCTLSASRWWSIPTCLSRCSPTSSFRSIGQADEDA